MSTQGIASWYAAQTPRDQRVLQWGAVAVVLILLVGVLLPLHRKVNESRVELQQLEDDLQWMHQVAPTLAAAGPGPVAATRPEDMLVLVDQSARESGLGQALTGSQPAGKGALRVQLERADFNALVSWLSRLSSQHGVQVESATFTGGSPGIVNATLQLRTR